MIFFEVLLNRLCRIISYILLSRWDWWCLPVILVEPCQCASRSPLYPWWRSASLLFSFQSQSRRVARLYLWLCRWTGSYFQLQHEQKYNLCSFESCGSVGSSMTSHRLPSAEPCHIMKPWLAGWSVHKETLCLYSQQRVFLHNTIRQRNVGMRNQPGCNQTVREESWQQISAF